MSEDSVANLLGGRNISIRHGTYLSNLSNPVSHPSSSSHAFLHRAGEVIPPFEQIAHNIIIAVLQRLIGELPKEILIVLRQRHGDVGRFLPTDLLQEFRLHVEMATPIDMGAPVVFFEADSKHLQLQQYVSNRLRAEQYLP